MWLIFLWGAAVPFGMAVDGEVRPVSWTDGLAMAFGLLVVLLVLMFFAPRFTGMWAMGFAAGSLVALVISLLRDTRCWTSDLRSKPLVDGGLWGWLQSFMSASKSMR